MLQPSGSSPRRCLYKFLSFVNTAALRSVVQRGVGLRRPLGEINSRIPKPIDPDRANPALVAGTVRTNCARFIVVLSSPSSRPRTRSMFAANCRLIASPASRFSAKVLQLSRLLPQVLVRLHSYEGHSQHSHVSRRCVVFPRVASLPVPLPV